jgi:broad specificity phosphatase PhoE
MSELPLLYVVRHGATAWSESHQHTGRTDLPLTEKGEVQARQLRERLATLVVAQVFTSPLKRAAHTCELAGFVARAEMDPDLLEWDYGEYEGKRSAEIWQVQPDWDLFRDGCPGGETPSDVARRVDQFLAKVRKVECNVLVFSSGHLLRMLAARWLGLPPSGGRYFFCSTASLGILGYEHNLAEPVVRRWNEEGSGS